jgi:hypothetical protein
MVRRRHRDPTRYRLPFGPEPEAHYFLRQNSLGLTGLQKNRASPTRITVTEATTYTRPFPKIASCVREDRAET